MNPRVCAGALPGPRGPCARSRVSRGGLARGSPSALRPGFRPGMHSAGVHPAPLRASRDPTRRRRHRGHRPPKPARVGRPAGGKLCWRLPLSQPLFSLWPSPRRPLRSSPQRQDAPGWDPGRGKQLFPRQGFRRRDHAAAGSAPSHRVRTLFQARLVLPLHGNPVPAAATTQNYPHRCWAAEKILQRWGRWGGDRCLAPCPPSKQQREFQTDTGVEGKRSGRSQYAI